MSRLRLPLLLLLLTLSAACSERPAGEEHLLILEDERYVVGLLPAVGGRLVVFRRTDGENVILSDPRQWPDAADTAPAAAADSGWTAYNGHIAWLGPQHEWWTQQELDPARREGAAAWPPDPYLIYGRYQVIEQSPRHAVLQGPASPVSGVAFTKRYQLEAQGLVITLTATNTSDASVSWDLWSNTRFEGRTTAPMVPLPEDDADFRLEWNATSPRSRGMVFYRVVDGHFTLQMGEHGDSGTANNSTKYFMNPGAPYLAAFRDDNCFLKHIAIAAGDPAPQQGRVEIYVHRTDRDALLEIEHHGPYTTLHVGESMELSERWELHPYAGTVDPIEQVAFLRKLMTTGQANDLPVATPRSSP